MRQLLTAALLALASPVHGQGIEEIIDISGDGLGNALLGPRAVAVDSAGNAYVAGYGSSTVFRVQPDGTTELILDHSGDGLRPLVSPYDMVVDSADNVYVAAFDSHAVFRVTPSGVISAVLDTKAGGVGVLENPFALAIDASDTLYVSGFSSDNVFSVTSTGTVTELIRSTGDGVHALSAPTGVAVDAAGNVFVAGFLSDNIFRISPGGRIDQIMDATGDGVQPLTDPRFLAVDGLGRLLVPGGTSDNVFRVDPGGTIELVLDASGDGAGNTMDLPMGPLATGGGDFYVTAWGSHKVFHVSEHGMVKVVIDSSGDGSGAGFLNPWTLAHRAGQLFVAGDESENAFSIEVPCKDPIGTNYCGPANVNSSGRPAQIAAAGDVRVHFDALVLEATQTATNQFGFFLNSQTQAFVANPGGSQGNLCLGGSIGRHSADITSTGPMGEFSLEVDLGAVPTPGGAYAVQPGETWNWQAWFRDDNPGQTSNFTDGVSITWE